MGEGEGKTQGGIHVLSYMSHKGWTEYVLTVENMRHVCAGFLQVCVFLYF